MNHNDAPRTRIRSLPPAAPKQHSRLRGGRWSLLVFAIAITLAGLPCPSFAGLRSDFTPWNAIEGFDGQFYGTMVQGVFPGGSIYTLSPLGELKHVYKFPYLRNGNSFTRAGMNPAGRLSIGQDGSMVGSTQNGGVFGNGLIFKIDPQGRYTSLYHFDDFGYSRQPVLATRNGHILAGFDGPNFTGVVRLGKDGHTIKIPTSGYVISLAETANDEIIAGTAGRANGLWRLNSENEFERFSFSGYIPHRLIPLPNGGLLCLTQDELLRFSATGEVEFSHDFYPDFEGKFPNFLTIAKDGSYIGSTFEGGLERAGTLFRVVPETDTFTLLGHLPAPGRRGPGMKWMEEVFPHYAAAESGNHPPMAKDDIVHVDSLRSTNGGLPKSIIPVLANDRDTDSEPLTIIATGSAEHGEVDFDFISQTITYTANTPVASNDSFTYTIVDGSGGTAIGHVIIRTNPEGRYFGEISSPENPQTGDPGTPVGTLSVVIDADRNAVAKLEILGNTYRFTGRFNELNRFGTVLTFNPRLGKSAAIQLSLRPDGAGWIVEADIRRNGLPFLGSCALNAN